MRVVIVGGAGFMGSAIAAAVRARGHAVTVLDTAGRLGLAGPRLGDATTAAFDFALDTPVPALFEGADALVHLGCTTNPALSMQDMAYDAASNIAPSLRLFDAAAAAGVRRVVFSSSGGTVYGAPDQLPVPETHASRPLSAYGVSKWAIEHYLALHGGVQGVSLRVSNPYGAQQLEGAAIGVIARYVAQVAAGEPLQVWGDGRIVRDYIAIEDVAEAFAVAVDAPALGHAVYNIGSGEGRDLLDIIEAVFRAAGRRVPVTHLPGRAYDVPAIVLDPARFIADTGWRPRIALDDGVAALWRQAAGRA